jgi:hypothetical protein
LTPIIDIFYFLGYYGARIENQQVGARESWHFGSKEEFAATIRKTAEDNLDDLNRLSDILIEAKEELERILALVEKNAACL